MNRNQPIKAVLWALTALCLSASAQEGADQLPDLPPEVRATVPPMDCAQPKIPDRASMPVEDIDYFIRKVNAYGGCVSAYIKNREAEAKKYNDLARAQAEAGNAAVKEITGYRAKVVEFQERHKPKKLN